MLRTRKTKNRYQINIAVYNERLSKCTNPAARLRLKNRIHLFKTVIKRIEIRESYIKKADKAFKEYFGLTVPMSEVLMYRKRGELLKIRSLFFYQMRKYSIDSTSIRFYYRLKVDKDKFRSIKKTDVKRVKQKYMDDWNKLRSYTNNLNN